MSNRSGDNLPRGRLRYREAGDGEHVRATRRGRTKAFDELVRRHERRMTATALRLVGDLHDALEITQEAFLRAYRHLETLESPERFASWLLRIVTNLALNLRRDRAAARSRTTPERIVTGDTAQASRVSSERPEDGLRATELAEHVRRALGELPITQRAALVLFSIEQLPQREVAEILGCSVEAVKWHVFQARKKVRRKLAHLIG